MLKNLVLWSKYDKECCAMLQYKQMSRRLLCWPHKLGVAQLIMMVCVTDSGLATAKTGLVKNCETCSVGQGLLLDKLIDHHLL